MKGDVDYHVAGILVATAILLGYFDYQEGHKTYGIEISLGSSNISVEKK